MKISLNITHQTRRPVNLPYIYIPVDGTVLDGFFGANIGYRVTDRLNVTRDGGYTMSEGDETKITGQLGAEFIF